MRDIGGSNDWLQFVCVSAALDRASSDSSSPVADRKPAFCLLGCISRPFSYMRSHAKRSARFLWADAFFDRGRCTHIGGSFLAFNPR